MINQTLFKNFNSCKAQIEKDFQIDLSQPQNKILFRAENGIFEKTEPSMKRLLDFYKMDFYTVSPFIDFEEIYTEYFARRHGLGETLSLGFLQHYGFPTDLLDLSPSLKTTFFFAHYDNIAEPNACIGVFDIKTVSKYYEIIDLTTHQYAQRPKKQEAWALRHRVGSSDFKSPACDEKFKVIWYKFIKNRDDVVIVNSNKREMYPSEEELAYFFSKDFYVFFRNHNFYQMLSNEQRKRIENHLLKIFNNLL